MTTTWTIAIDWDRDGTFSGDDIVTDRAIWINWFLGFRKPYMDIADNSVLGLVLDNRDRRFSPEYDDVSNPLAGKVQPLRPVRIQSNDGTTTRTHWTGWVESVHPAVNKFGERVVKLLCTGAMQFLTATETQIELQENQRTDQIIDTLIKEVIFPPALSSAWVVGDANFSLLGESTYLADLTAYSEFEEGQMTLNMAGDNWVRQGGYTDQTKDTFDVYRGIKDITAAERGKFFFDREGKAVFWNRHHVLDTDTIEATFNDTMTGMEYTFASLDQTKNDIIVTCHPRSVDETTTTLWELEGSVIRVAPGETREVYVKYKDENDTRVGGKDVTLEGIEYIQGATTATVEAKANGANMVFKNNSTTTEAIIEKCVVKGRKILNQGQMEARSKDQVSITNYGRRVMNINLPSIDNLEEAQYIADFEKDRRKDPFGLAQTITMQSHANRGGNQHNSQLALTVGSLVNVQETQTAHSDTYFIIGEAHELANGGRHWKTTWYLEPQIDTLPWKLGENTDRGKIGNGTYLAL